MIKKITLFAAVLLSFTGFTANAADPVATFYGNKEFVHHQDKEDITEKDYPCSLDYAISYNDDQTLTINASVNWGSEGAPVGAIDIMYVDVNGAEQPGSMDRVNGTKTTNDTYNQGQSLPIAFRIPAYAGDVVRCEITYVVGSTSLGSLGLTAEATDITMTSANLSYTLTVPDGVNEEDVVITYGVTGSEDMQTATANPIVLDNLDQNKNYSYTLTATANVEDETLTTSTVVEFKTLRDATQQVHNYQIVNDFLNAYKIGENVSKRRAIPVSLQSDIIYNEDKTLSIDFTMDGADDVVGIVAEICINGNWSGNINGTKDAQGYYHWTTPQGVVFEEGQTVDAFYRLAYADGLTDVKLPNFKVGDQNDKVEYDTPVEVVLTATETKIPFDVEIPFCAYLKDANGNFVLTQQPALTLENNTADGTISGDFITINQPGSVDLVGKFDGATTATITFFSGMSAEAVNLAKGIVPIAECEDGHVHDNLEFITDENENTEVNLGSETPNHIITIDLGKKCSVEYMTIVFEGASATDYTITLSSDKDEQVEPQFVVTNGLGGSGTTPRANFSPESPIEAQFVTITTSKAFELNWGIKIRQLYVYGTEIEDENLVYVHEHDKEAKKVTFKVSKGNIVVEALYDDEDLTGRANAKRKAGTVIDGSHPNWEFPDDQTAVYTLPDEGDGAFYKIYSDAVDSEKHSLILDTAALLADPDNSTVGVEEIGAENAEVEYFTLQGVKVKNPEHGIFIKVQNGKAVKVVL